MPIARIAVFACAWNLTMGAPNDYASELAAWRKAAEERLKADDGWLTVAGLFWLKEGRNAFGSAADNALVLPSSAPAHAGVFVMKNRKVTLEPRTGLKLNGQAAARRVLVNDNEGKQDLVQTGPVTLFVIDRGDRTGIRMRDLESQFRREFTGRVWYPAREAYRVVGRFEPAAERTVRIPNVVGTYDEYQTRGTVAFRLGGQELRLEPVLSGGKLFFIFKDKTAAKTTYGAGRFLYAELPVDGKVVVDFNQAVNPPCAFTPYATCPLPPKHNQLPVAVEAGEKNYGSH